MADRLFHTATLKDETIQLEFTLEGEPKLSITIPRDNANQLAAGILHCLRAARHLGQRIGLIPVQQNQYMSVNEMPLKDATVGVDDKKPAVTILHLVTDAGLSLTYSMSNLQARQLGEALTATAGAPRIGPFH